MLQKRIDIAISPARFAANAFVNNFADSLVNRGFSVREFTWKKVPTAKTVILHWPNDFFVNSGTRHLARCAIKLASMHIYRATLGIRFVWVVHNLQPHDAGALSPALSKVFLASLDGIIFLSEFSKEAIDQLYGIPAGLKVLQTVHGNYRNNMILPVCGQKPITGNVQLLNFGQIRPYKNVDNLIETLAGMPDSGIDLMVAGCCYDADLLHRIKMIAHSSENITLDARSELLPDIDLERHIDNAHAVVLPYQKVLNSGAIFLALSRNRPVLAPKMGSLPELRAQVGSDWIMLYDGEMNEQVLYRFSGWLRQRNPSATCDLSRFSWERIGEDLSNFVKQLHE
ncbi:glycosyltransferase [Bradyrhizobium sp. CCBAU 45384]|uniref:glycosyltransferase n=1 Tax=Bradyrhizobium sp. CCBAU 45384 TaxID=858428 RepID=UPI00230621F2|nr:glycosyltransferase [Bradyrhizobium sp. CCBAU 45384]